MMTLPRANRVALTVGFLTVVAGCGDSLQTDQGPFRTTVVTHAAERNYDLLFIVDDSAGFAPYAETAAAGLTQLANVLEALPGGRPSIHAAFVPASTSTAGCASPPPRGSDCRLTTADPFATVDACGASPNFPGALGETFTCLGSFQSRDCAALTPLAAMREALGGGGSKSPLTGPTPFLRSDAELALVVLASGDDASARDGTPIPVQEYVDFVRSLKPDSATPVAVSIIAPPPLTAIPRLTDFVQAFGGDGLVYPLTVGANIGPAFQTLAQRLAVLLSPPCATGIRDLNPELPGLQPECTAEDWSTVVDGNVLRDVHRQLPSCETAGPPCWRLSPNSAMTNCPSGSWVLDIDREADWCPQLAAKTVVSCRGCADPNDPACAGP
jgi:hypothetical protein